MGDIVLAGATSGTITLQPTAVAGSNTLTLPAANATVLTSASPASDLPSSINGPAFSAYSNGNQSVTSTTATKVTLDVEEFDTNNNFASSRFTPTVAGYYQINGEVWCNGTSITYAQARIYKNGSLLKIGSMYNGGGINEFSSSVCSVVYCNGSTDYIELYGLITATSPSFIGGAVFYTYMSGCLVRAA